jgi:dihydrofolate reductase
MRKVILSILVSLDGYFEGPNREIDWHVGNGKPLFKGIKDKLNLKLLKTKTFRSGNVMLCYQPIGKENKHDHKK